jgi:hypothetical protein
MYTYHGDIMFQKKYENNFEKKNYKQHKNVKMESHFFFYYQRDTSRVSRK